MDLSKIGGALTSFNPLIGAATSLFGSIFGNSQSSSNVDKQIAAQRQENALNREFNANQAQIAREFDANFQRELIQSYRDYNTPQAMMKRLQDAGLNPNLAVGQLGNGDSMTGGVGSTAASSQGSISPVGYSPLDTTSAGNILADTRLKNAQADKLSSEADKAGAETVTIENIREGLVKTQDSIWKLNEELAKLPTAQLQEIAKRIDEIDSKIAVNKEQVKFLAESTRDMSESAISRYLDNAWKEATLDNRIKIEASKLGISETEYKYGVASFALKLMNLQGDTSQKLSSAAMLSDMGKYFREVSNNTRWQSLKIKQMLPLEVQNMRIQNATLDFNLDQDRKFDSWERSMNMINSTISSTADLIGSVKGISIQTRQPAGFNVRR